MHDEDYDEIYSITVEGRDDGIYLFRRLEDARRFACAVHEAGGSFTETREPLNGPLSTQALIAAELEDDLPEELFDLGPMDLELLREQRRALTSLLAEISPNEGPGAFFSQDQADALEGIINLADQILSPIKTEPVA